MIKKDDVIELKIEKLLYGGSSLGRIDNFAVFVSGGCPEDILKIKILKVNKTYAIGEILEILNPSKYRKKPKCQIFNACGACMWQYIDYDFLLEQKKLMVEEALSIKVNDVIKSPEIKAYRHKMQYPVAQAGVDYMEIGYKNSKRLLAGYYKEKTHDITNIKYCEMNAEPFNEIVQFIRDNWALGAYCEKTKKGLLRHIVLKKSSSSNEILIILILNCDKKPNVEAFFGALCEKFPTIKGCLINYNTLDTNKIFGNKTELVLGQDFYTEVFGKKTFKVGAESFFQVNPKCAKKLFVEIKKHIEPNSKILDCYGGVGVMGIYAIEKASHITLVEENADAINFAKENFELNGIKNFEILQGRAEDVLNGGTFDCAIIDPPRKGCERKVLEILAKTSKKIIYVSCNPQTLARDLKILTELGFKIKKAQPYDMFPFTYHVEMLCVLER